MRYMTDASLADMAPELRRRGIDCETVHKLMRGNESSQERISDGEIVPFLRDSNGAITLIVMDHDLAEHCKHAKLAHLRVQDTVAEHILARRETVRDEGRMIAEKPLEVGLRYIITGVEQCIDEKEGMGRLLISTTQGLQWTTSKAVIEQLTSEETVFPVEADLIRKNSKATGKLYEFLKEVPLRINMHAEQ